MGGSKFAASSSGQRVLDLGTYSFLGLPIVTSKFHKVCPILGSGVFGDVCLQVSDSMDSLMEKKSKSLLGFRMLEVRVFQFR